MAPGIGGSTLAAFTSSAWTQRQLPAQLQHQRIDPGFDADLAVLLRQDGGVVIAVLGNALERGQHFLGALLRREGGPGRIGGLRGGDGIADILRGGRGGMTDDDTRLGRDRQSPSGPRSVVPCRRCIKESLLILALRATSSSLASAGSGNWRRLHQLPYY